MPPTIATRPATLTREAWLQTAVTELRRHFSAQGHTVPPVQVSIGFTGSGMRSMSIGQCWSTLQATDQLNHIFIIPGLGDPVEILDTLVHELVHAVLDCHHGHGKVFKAVALSVGLEGPMRSAHAGKELRAKLTDLAARLGPLPHAALHTPPKAGHGLKRPSARCKECGYEVPMLKKFLAYGPPLCPRHKTEMDAIGDWNHDPF